LIQKIKKMTLTFGIGIPVEFDRHYMYIGHLLDLIEKSSVLPNQVVFSISSCYIDELLSISRDYPFVIKIYQTKERKNTSENRNIAGSMLDTDIISFMDVDDLPHIDRNKILINCFEDENVNAVVHECLRTLDRNDQFIYDSIKTPIIYKNYINTIKPDFHCAISDILHIPYASGHITIRKTIFDKVKYIEDVRISGGKEDSLYTLQLIDAGFPITFVYEKLSLYYN
jgi:hypothetical protein